MDLVSKNEARNDISGRIEELKKRIHLSESKKKVNYEEGEESKTRNEENINQLKLEIEKLKEKVTELTAHWQNVEQPLKSLLIKRKKPHVCTKNLHLRTGQEERRYVLADEIAYLVIVELLDQWQYNLSKQYNLIIHEEKRNGEKIVKLQAKEKELSKSKSPRNIVEDWESNQELKRIQELENKFEKLQMKTAEAELVQKKYLSVKSIIGDEILHLQKEINCLDDGIAKAKNELPQLTTMVQIATQSNQAIESQLNQQEKYFNKQKQSWEKSLQMYNQQADQIQLSEGSENGRLGENLTSSIEAYSFEESLSPATELASTIQRSDSKELLEQLKGTPGADKQELTKFLEQKETKMRLELLKKQLEQQISQLQEENAKMEAQLQDNLLSNEQNNDNSLEELQMKLEEEKQHRTDILQSTEHHIKLIEVLHGTLRQLCMKIVQGCKMPSGFTLSPSPDETLDLLMACTERVDLLVEQCRDYDRGSATKMYQGIKYNENVEEAQSVLKPKKRSQQLEEPLLPTTSSKEDHDTSSDHAILTRAMIKRQAKLMIEQHAKLHQKGQHGQKKIKSNT